MFTRCGCRDGHGGRRGISCPPLGQVGHGSWYFTADLPRHCDGERRRLRRGGYPTSEAAAAALSRVAVPPASGPGGGPVTVGGLAGDLGADIRIHLRQQLGGVLLWELTAWDVELVFRRLFGAGVTAVTARQVFSTLRTALNAAVRES